MWPVSLWAVGTVYCSSAQRPDKRRIVPPVAGPGTLDLLAARKKQGAGWLSNGPLTASSHGPARHWDAFAGSHRGAQSCDSREAAQLAPAPSKLHALEQRSRAYRARCGAHRGRSSPPERPLDSAEGSLSAPCLLQRCISAALHGTISHEAMHNQGTPDRATDWTSPRR